ncbi:MAG: hypothetical protein IPH72_15950 [Sandaracinaceae bacterium]|nr:hypothetical protein [Sandaracinaceae bacterium]
MARTQPSDARAAEALRGPTWSDPSAIAVWMDILILVDSDGGARRARPTQPSRRHALEPGAPVSEARDREVVDDIVRVCARMPRVRAARPRPSTPVTDVPVDIAHPEEGIALI